MHNVPNPDLNDIQDIYDWLMVALDALYSEKQAQLEPAEQRELFLSNKLALNEAISSSLAQNNIRGLKLAYSDIREQLFELSSNDLENFRKNLCAARK